jgi:hypothetical protein
MTIGQSTSGINSYKRHSTTGHFVNQGRTRLRLWYTLDIPMAQLFHISQSKAEGYRSIIQSLFQALSMYTVWVPSSFVLYHTATWNSTLYPVLSMHLDLGFLVLLAHQFLKLLVPKGLVIHRSVFYLQHMFLRPQPSATEDSHWERMGIPTRRPKDFVCPLCQTTASLSSRLSYLLENCSMEWAIERILEE